MRLRRIVASLAMLAMAAGCAVPVSGSPSPVIVAVPPASPTTAFVLPPPQPTVTVREPAPASDVPASSQWYAQQSWIDAQPWIAITPAAGQTPCQWLYAHGYSYPQAFAAWAKNGYPPSWSATGDGYPCQRTYGRQH